MDTIQLAQDLKVQWGCLQGLRSPGAQALQIPFGGERIVKNLKIVFAIFMSGDVQALRVAAFR
jgi:hypothetical protein